MKLPVPVVRKLEELDKLIEAYPQDIPVHEMAKFLGKSAASLREMIEQGQCPFAFGGAGSLRRNFAVPAATFYLWYTKGASHNH